MRMLQDAHHHEVDWVQNGAVIHLSLLEDLNRDQNDVFCITFVQSVHRVICLHRVLLLVMLRTNPGAGRCLWMVLHRLEEHCEDFVDQQKSLAIVQLSIDAEQAKDLVKHNFPSQEPHASQHVHLRVDIVCEFCWLVHLLGFGFDLFSLLYPVNQS